MYQEEQRRGTEAVSWRNQRRYILYVYNIFIFTIQYLWYTWFSRSVVWQRIVRYYLLYSCGNPSWWQAINSLEENQRLLFLMDVAPFSVFQLPGSSDVICFFRRSVAYIEKKAVLPCTGTSAALYYHLLCQDTFEFVGINLQADWIFHSFRHDERRRFFLLQELTQFVTGHLQDYRLVLDACDTGRRLQFRRSCFGLDGSFGHCFEFLEELGHFSSGLARHAGSLALFIRCLLHGARISLCLFVVGPSLKKKRLWTDQGSPSE